MKDNQKFILFLGLTFLIRLFLGAIFPLTADESYYWLWSKHLSWSYVDHPPMVALINYLFTLGKESIFGIRLGANVCITLTTVFIYLAAQKVFGRQIAFWSALTFQIIPHFLIIWLTQFVEVPLGLFWTISLWLMALIVKEKKPVLWYPLAISIGLGYLSKYTMFVFWPCLAVFLFFTPEARFWLKKKEPYFCFVLSAIFFAPVVLWNQSHSWISFAFHGGQAAGTAWGSGAAPFLIDQLAHFSPIFLFLLLPIYRHYRKSNPAEKLLLAFSIPVLALFFLLSFKIKVWAHWPAIGYIAAIPLIVNYSAQKGKMLERVIMTISFFSALILGVLFFASPAILLRQKDYAANFLLSKRFPKEIKVFAQTNVSASLLEFYSRRPVYMAVGLFKTHDLWGEKQYQIWGIPDLHRNENIIYFGEDNPNFRKLAEKYFSKTEEITGLKLNLIEDYIRENYKFFRLSGFKQNVSHP